MYKEPIRRFLNIPHYYDFSSINELLFEFFGKVNEMKPITHASLIASKELNKSFLQFNCRGSHKIIENFIKLKERNYDLQSIEYIVLNWLKVMEEYAEDEETYKGCIEKVLVQHYVDILVKAIDAEQIDDDFKEIINNVIGHSNNASVFLNSDKFNVLHWYNMLIVDIKNEDIAEVENEEVKEELKSRYNCLSVIMGLFLFDGHFHNYQNQVISVIEDPIFVNDCFEKMKNFIEKMMKTNYERYKRLEPFIRINDEILKQVDVIVKK